MKKILHRCVQDQLESLRVSQTVGWGGCGHPLVETSPPPCEVGTVQCLPPPLTNCAVLGKMLDVSA